MSNLLDVLRGFAAWWVAGLATMGAHLTHVYEAPLTPPSSDTAANANREAWEEEPVRHALSPWWL